MEGNADAVTQFLREFTAEKISPTSEDDVQIRCGIVGNYSLKPREIDGEVTDWVLNYLEQRKCPYFLAIALAKKVALDTSTDVCKRLMHSNGEKVKEGEAMPLENATSLHTEAIGRLRELCCELRDHPGQADVNTAHPEYLEASVFAIKNGRRKMEDRHVILHDLNVVCDLKGAPSSSYYAVFDGHAGVETASFASAHLHSNIAKHPSFKDDPRKAITEAFKITDDQFAERASRENLKSGATAVCALIRESTLYVAWVGDSQALLVKQGRPYVMMNPHKPEREDERKRIEELGGYIYHHGTWRVNGTLAVSRALGDEDHKPFISNEPEITVAALDGTEDFLVIACDGLWDKMSHEDVSVSLYRHLVDNPQDADSIAAKLVHQSKLMGSNDNITTIVVFLRDLQSIIADAPKYAAIFPQLEGIRVSSISQIPNGTAGKSYDEQMSDKLDSRFQRPTYFHKDLNLDQSDWSPDSQGMQEIHSQNGKYGIAEGMPPEQTSLSELPTPPIDEVVASKQFSEYSTSEQLKIFQEHLEAQGFHDVSLGEIQTSASENLQFLPSEMADDMGYLADGVQSGLAGPKEDAGLPFEDITDVPQNFKSVDISILEDNSSAIVTADHVVQHVTHEEVLSTASDLVLNTIETAVKHVSLGNSNTDSGSSVQECYVVENPFEQQANIVEQPDLSADKSNPAFPKSSHQLNPNAAPFVMRDFSSFNPDFVPDSSVHQFTETGDISLLDLSSASVTAPNDVLVDASIPPAGGHSDEPDAAALNSSELHSPLPSAPPIEALEEQQTCISEEFMVHVDVPSTCSDIFLSDLENGDMGGRIPSVLTEVSAAVQEGQPFPIQELGDQPLFAQDTEKQSCLPAEQHEVQLPSVPVCEDLVVVEHLKPVDQPLPLQGFDQPPVQEPEQTSPAEGLDLSVQEPPLVLGFDQQSPMQVVEQPLLVQGLDQQSPMQVVEQPLLVQGLDQLSLVQESEQPLPVQGLDQPSPVQEPEQPPEVQGLDQPSPVQVPEQPPEVQGLDQPSPVQVPEQPLPVQGLDQPSPVQEPEQPPEIQGLDQPSPVQEPEQSPAVQGLDQPSPVQEPEQPPPVQGLDQPSPVQEPEQPPAVQGLDQPSLVQEPEQPPAVQGLDQPVQEPEQPPPVQELEQPPPVQRFDLLVKEPVEQSVQEPAEQPLQEPVDQLDHKPDVKQTVSDSITSEQFTEENFHSDSLLLSDKGMFEIDDLSCVNKASSEVQDSLSQLSIIGSEDSSGNKADHSMDSVPSDHPLQQESLADSDIGSCVSDVSTHVTKQVIGKDSLLPKEVQDKLLEVTSTSLPSESVAEDAPVGTVAVDLQKVPDGVPEAEGVTEDSDSEKDGGWSYVKADSSSQEQKTVKKAVGTNKVSSKKPTAAVSSKDRKVMGKTVGTETRIKPRSTPGIADTTKKTLLEKTDKKAAEAKEKKGPATSVKTASPQTVPPKVLTTDRKLTKKPTTTMPRSSATKPNGTSASTVTKPPASNVTSKTVSSTKLQVGGAAEKIIGKPTHSSTPFRPHLSKPTTTTGTTKPLTRPASATASHSGGTSSISAPHQSSLSQKPQPRASSAPLANKTLPGAKVNVAESKSSASSAEVKPKPTGTAFRKPLPPAAKKQDVKETKDSTNKQIVAKKTTQVSASTTSTQVRRTGISTSTVKVDSALKKSSVATTTATASDTKTLKTSAGRTDISKSSTVSKTGTARSRVFAQSKQLSKPVKPENDKKASEPKPSKNGPKKIVNDTSSSDQKCNADNRIQEVSVEKGMLEVNAQETADDKLAAASVDPLIGVLASEVVSKAELKQESNVIECPVPVTPAEEV